MNLGVLRVVVVLVVHLASYCSTVLIVITLDVVFLFVVAQNMLMALNSGVRCPTMNWPKSNAPMILSIYLRSVFDLLIVHLLSVHL